VCRQTSRSSDAVIAYTILRISFGANIMLHGVSRIVMGHAAFLAYLTHYFEKTSYVPASLLSSFATVQPWVELILGLLLMIGLATRFSLIRGRPRDHVPRHRHKPRAGLARVRTPVNLRIFSITTCSCIWTKIAIQLMGCGNKVVSRLRMPENRATCPPDPAPEDWCLFFATLNEVTMSGTAKSVCACSGALEHQIAFAWRFA